MPDVIKLAGIGCICIAAIIISALATGHNSLTTAAGLSAITGIISAVLAYLKGYTKGRKKSFNDYWNQ